MIGAFVIGILRNGLNMGGVSAFTQQIVIGLVILLTVWIDQMRHRLPHFGHLFAGASYASQYYVYLWAEVLDADGYDAFVEAGNPFDATTAQRLRKFIYSSGNTLEPTEAYRNFRGRAPLVTPMLKKKGLLAAAA